MFNDNAVENRRGGRKPDEQKLITDNLFVSVWKDVDRDGRHVLDWDVASKGKRPGQVRITNPAQNILELPAWCLVVSRTFGDCPKFSDELRIKFAAQATALRQVLERTTVRTKGGILAFE